MKANNLYQDTESTEAPYADEFILDAGGIDVKLGGENIAHISFDNLDPFEIAYFAMPDDWEPHPEFDEDSNFIATAEEILENGVYKLLNALGDLRGWTRP